MDPITFSLIMVGMNMAGSFLKSRADAQAAEASAQVLDQNAQISDYAAGDAIARGQIAEGRVLQGGSAFASKQKAALASSGVDTQSGSAADLQASTGGLSAMDALTVRSNAAREAWGYTTKASQFRFEAAVTRATGKARATGEILGGAASSLQYLRPFLTVSGQAGGGGSDYSQADGSLGGF